MIAKDEDDEHSTRSDDETRRSRAGLSNLRELSRQGERVPTPPELPGPPPLAGVSRPPMTFDLPDGHRRKDSVLRPHSAKPPSNQYYDGNDYLRRS